MNLKNDEVFQRVKDDIEIDNGLMKDAWIMYKGEKWYRLPDESQWRFLK